MLKRDSNDVMLGGGDMWCDTVVDTCTKPECYTHRKRDSLGRRTFDKIGISEFSLEIPVVEASSSAF